MESFEEAEQRLARTMGNEMRRLREARYLTQGALARRAGHYSRTTVATVEGGSGRCSLQLVQGCDDALQADGTLVRLYRELRAARTRRKESAKQRAGAGMGGGSFPVPDGLRPPAFLEQVKQSLDRYGPPSEALPRPEDMERRCARASTRYQSGDYEAASALLVDLIGDAMALAAQRGVVEPRALGAQVWTYRLAAMLATRCGDSGTARLAADRAAAAATWSGSPLLQGVAMYQVACALHLAGELETAQQAATDAAETLIRQSRQASPVQISVRGALLLVAAVIAAWRGERRESCDLLVEAQRLADGLGVDANHAWTAFGPTNVRTHALAAAVALGDTDQAIDIGETIDPEQFPHGLVGRRCQVHLDTARAHADRRHDSEAVVHLLLANAGGPQVVRYSPEARWVLEQLLGRERRPATPGLRYLSRRVGILA